MFSFKQLKYFVAAADAGQISQAAVELNVSQSAVTAAIRQLEDDLDVRLFVRQASGVSLTAEGGRFLNHARGIMAAVNAAARAPLTEDMDVAGTVRVGVSYTVAGYFFPQHLTRFARSHPRVKVELVELPRRTIEEQIRLEGIDLTVMLVSNLRDQEHIEHETLFRSRRKLWLAVGHPLSAIQPVPLQAIAEEPFIMLTVDEASETASHYWQKNRLKPRVIFETSSVEAVRSLVAEGAGVTILSDMVYRPWSLEGQRIERRDVLEEVPTMDVGVAWRRGTPLTPAARLLRDFLALSIGGGEG